MVCFNVCSMFLVLNNVIYFEWLVFLIYEYFVIYYEIGIVNKWMGFKILVRLRVIVKIFIFFKKINIRYVYFKVWLVINVML